MKKWQLGIYLTAGILVSSEYMAPARAADNTSTPLFFKDSSGQQKPLTVISSLDEKGNPLVSAYRGSDNHWHTVSPAILVCSLDTNGSPVACPSSTMTGNQPNGVAGLDINGAVTAPINTASVTSAQAFNVAPIAARVLPNSIPNSTQLSGYSLWYGNQVPLAKYGTTNPTIVQDWWVTPPETLHLGGQSEGASGFLNVHCSPYAGSNAGACSQIMLGTPNVQGQAAGIGPGATGIAGYDNFDVTNQALQATGSVPLYVITSNTAQNVFPPASDGLDHTPTFTASGATFANPLPADMSAWFIKHPQGIRLMTNEIGCQSCAIQTYAGIVKSVSTNSAGLITGLNVAGWQIFTSTWKASTTPKPGVAQIPGQTTVDGSTPAIDTTWSNFGAPAIMVGVYTKDFSQYSLCTLDGPLPNRGRGDINFPSGNANNQLRVCEGWEMDLLNNDPVDFRPVIHGLTVAFAKGKTGAKPSYDSYDVNASGANSISYEQSGEFWTLPFHGLNFMVSGYDGTPYAKGSVKNVVQWRQSENIGYTADGGYQRNNIMPGIWTVRNVAAGCPNPDGVTCDGSNGSSKDITTNIGVQIDWYGAQNKGPNGDPIWNSPTQEHLELNPNSNHGGIDLCANGQTDTSCALQVASNGVTTPKQITTPRLNVGSASLFIDADGDYTISGADRSRQVGINFPWLSYSQLGTPSFSGVLKYCRDCYSSLRASGNNQTGIMVTWNGSNWVDGVGNNVLH